MPPTIAGWRAMYSRDPVDGKLYGIGVPPPPSPFIADGVEPTPLPVDFVWGDTSQVTPVGSQANDEVYVGVDDPRVTFPTSTVELWHDTSVTPTVLKYWDGTAWAAAVTHPTQPIEHGMRKQSGLAITTGQYYYSNYIFSSAGTNIVQLIMSVHSGGSVQVFDVALYSAISPSPDQGFGGLLGNSLGGTKMIDRVGVYFHGGGARMKIRAAWTGTVNVGWELRDLENANPRVGGDTWAVETTGGAEIAAVAI